MEKIESKFIYKGETYELKHNHNGVKCYIEKDGYMALITDEKNNILFKIQAECAQNYGFLELVK